MRAISTIGILIGLMLILACGGDSDSSGASATSVPRPTSTTAPTATSVPAPTEVKTEKATLEIRVTDAPPDGVTKILLTVKDVEVNTSTGETGSGWQTIISEPQTFDLVALTGIEGSGERRAGTRTLQPSPLGSHRCNGHH